MLNWWLGRSAEDAPRDGGKFKQKTNCSDADSSHTDDPEPPETPAPVFAARAFKSALFGTPAYSDEDEPATPIKGTNTKLDSPGEALRMGCVSPTKPQGILLTPGTAATRRKTVSFGEEVVDKDDKSTIGRSGIPNDCPGKFPSPWTPRVDAKKKCTSRTTLTKTLEAARDENGKLSSSSENNDNIMTKLKTGPGFKNNTEAGKRVQTLASPVDDFDGDMTTDLNEPHSQSGRYWKSEYEKYHEEAMAEMRKLVKYKQLAKSYAKKKDSEAIELGEKLREEQQNVLNMEAKVAILVAQIAGKPLGGKDSESPHLMENPPRKTALDMKHKDQVDQFQNALQECDAQLDWRNTVPLGKRLSMTAGVPDSKLNHELNAASGQLTQMSLLREDAYSLRLNLLAAERKVMKLQDENARLSKDFTTVSDELKKSDGRRQSAEVQIEERSKSLQCLQNDYDALKGKAKSQRREAEILLDKRYKQVIKLKSEVASLKKKIEDSNPTDVARLPSRKPSRSAKQAVEDQTKLLESKSSAIDAEDLISSGSPRQLSKRFYGDFAPFPQTQDACDAGVLRVATKTEPNDNKIVPSSGFDDVDLLDIKLLVPNSSAWRTKTLQTDHSAKPAAETPKNSKQRKTHAVLSEIINNADVNASPIQVGNPLTPGFQQRFSNLSLESPKVELPSLEPSYEYGPSMAAKSNRHIASPRPSMFNISASPTKPVFNRATASGKDADTNRSTLGSSQLSSMNSRVRKTLPPDRAAAAKARLQQKNAEKKWAQGVGDQKENIR